MNDVTYIDPGRNEALRWLNGQLRWEATLDALRSETHDEADLETDPGAERPAA